MSVCLYVCMSVCLYVYMSACLYVCMSVCLYVCMSVCLYVCMSGEKLVVAPQLVPSPAPRKPPVGVVWSAGPYTHRSRAPKNPTRKSRLPGREAEPRQRPARSSLWTHGGLLAGEGEQIRRVGGQDLGLTRGGTPRSLPLYVMHGSWDPFASCAECWTSILAKHENHVICTQIMDTNV